MVKQKAPRVRAEGQGTEEHNDSGNSFSIPRPIADTQSISLSALHHALLSLANDLYNLQYDAECADTPSRRKKLSRDLRKIEDALDNLSTGLKAEGGLNRAAAGA